MPPLQPVMLTVRTREVLKPASDEKRQIIEVLAGEKVLGELPISRLEYEMLPHELGRVKIELIVQRSEITSLELPR